MPITKKVVAEETVIVAQEEAPETPLSSLGEDELKGLCASLNAKIISLHGEGKHEEADGLRPKHAHAQLLLQYKLNPTGHA